MQRIIITAIVAANFASFAGSVLAETPNAVPEAPFASAKTRAEVQAELTAYRSAGVNPSSISYNPLRNFHGTTTREAVRAGYLAEREQVHAFTSEDSGSGLLSAARRPARAPRYLASR